MNIEHKTPLWWRTLWRLRSRLFRRRPSGPVILLYHSISDRTRDPLRLSTPPELFEAQLRWLSDKRKVMPLQDFICALREHRLPPEAAAITFDDGYADNLNLAEPLLRRHSVHGTIFIAASCPGSGAEPWWEELDALILADDVLHGAFRLEDHDFLIDEAYEPAREQAWTVLEQPRTQRQRLFCLLSNLASISGPTRRQALLQSLRQLRKHPIEPRSPSRMADWQNLRTASAQGCLALGAHTLHHSRLSALPLLEMEAELRDGLRVHQEFLGQRPTGFAYPFGTSADFGPREQACVARLGFPWACANQAAHVNRFSGLFGLPRLLVTRQSVRELASMLGDKA